MWRGHPVRRGVGLKTEGRRGTWEQGSTGSGHTDLWCRRRGQATDPAVDPVAFRNNLYPVAFAEERSARSAAVAPTDAALLWLLLVELAAYEADRREDVEGGHSEAASGDAQEHRDRIHGLDFKDRRVAGARGLRKPELVAPTGRVEGFHDPYGCERLELSEGLALAHSGGGEEAAPLPVTRAVAHVLHDNPRNRVDAESSLTGSSRA